MQIGDTIESINDQCVKGKKVREVVSLIVGQHDTPVKFEVRRRAARESLTVTIKRGHVHNGVQRTEWSLMTCNELNGLIDFAKASQAHTNDQPASEPASVPSSNKRALPSSQDNTSISSRHEGISISSAPGKKEIGERNWALQALQNLSQMLDNGTPGWATEDKTPSVAGSEKGVTPTEVRSRQNPAENKPSNTPIKWSAGADRIKAMHAFRQFERDSEVIKERDLEILTLKKEIAEIQERERNIKVSERDVEIKELEMPAAALPQRQAKREERDISSEENKEKEIRKVINDLKMTLVALQQSQIDNEHRINEVENNAKAEIQALKFTVTALQQREADREQRREVERAKIDAEIKGLKPTVAALRQKESEREQKMKRDQKSIKPLLSNVDEHSNAKFATQEQVRI